MTAAATALPGTSSNHSFDVSSPASGPQNHKRPVGLTLANPNSHGFSQYPVSAPSSSAPLPPGPPNHSPVAPLHRNASFSHPPNYQSHVSSQAQALASAPTSATIPLSHSASAMPLLNQSFPSQNNPRARLPAQPGSAPPHGRVNEAQSQASFEPTAANPALPARPSTSSTPSASNVPNGKPASRDDSVVPPAALSNFPGLGFASKPTSAPQTKPAPQATPPSNPPAAEALRFFNTYLYDYLLKQGLFEVAQAFVASGVELDLVDEHDGTSASQAGSKPHNTHKRRRSEGSINAFNSSPQAGPTMLSTNDGANSAQPKSGNAANSNRSSNETPGSQGPSGDPVTNPSGNHVPNGVVISPHTSASPRSSSRDYHALRDKLPKLKLAMDTDQGFLFEWWSIFWDVFLAKTGRAPAPSKSVQVYAQTLAAASLGMPTEPGGLTKARREALGILAVPNSLDVQKAQLNDRIQQQYTLVNPTSYTAPHQEPGNVHGSRLSPHPLQAKQAFLAEQARQQQSRMQQQQQQQHYQRIEANLVRQRQNQLQQQQHAHAQQPQELTLRTQEPQLRQAPHMHQIHPAHHEQFVQQRQISMNVRRPGMMSNMSSDQAHAMMPPPPVQHGSPLNPHQQVYRPSRPPSRSGAAHVSGPFVANPAQPQRQPSRASNHANSPALQAHPRTPSASHASTPQPSAASTHNRASPAVSNGDQERKKRRLNEPIYNANEVIPPEQPSIPAQQMTPQQALAHQHQLAHHHQQMVLQQQQHRIDQQHQQHLAQQQFNQQNQFNHPQHMTQQHHMSQQLQLNPNHPMNQQHAPSQQHSLTALQQQQIAQMQASRRAAANHSDFAGSPSEISQMNMNVEAYNQSIHAKHSQAIHNVTASTNGQKGNNSTSPSKEAVNKSDENSMPPPPSRNMATQPSTPQSSASANKTTESTPMPTIVASSPNINQLLRSTSPNDQNPLSGGAAGNMCSGTDPTTAALSSSQSMSGRSMPNGDTEAKANAPAESQRANDPIESATGIEHGNDKSMYASDAGPKSHDKSGGLWSLDSAQQHQNQGNGGNLSSHISPSTNTGTQGLTSDEMNAVNSSNPIDQLFGTDSLPFDYDSSLFDAFINFDHSASDVANPDFS